MEFIQNCLQVLIINIPYSIKNNLNNRNNKNFSQPGRSIPSINSIRRGVTSPYGFYTTARYNPSISFA